MIFAALHVIYTNAEVVSLSRWVAEEQAPVVLAVVRRGGFAMVELVDPSVRRLRHPVASRLIPGCGAYCAPAENMP